MSIAKANLGILHHKTFEVEVSFMDSTLRGSHTCFVCNHAMIWATDFSGGGVILHGSEVAADHAVASQRMPQTNQVEFSVQITCPRCNSVNQFKSAHTV